MGRPLRSVKKYAGDLLMQKWYVEDYLTHKCVKNSGEKPQYFVEDDHDPIVPKAVFYQVQGEKKRRSGLAKDPSKLRFGNRLALNGRLICGKCGRTLKRYVKAQEELTDWRCRQRALVKKTDFHENVESRCDCRIVREAEVQKAVVMAFNTLPTKREELVVAQERMITGEIGRIDALLKTIDEQQDSLCVLSIGFPQNRKENSVFSDREFPFSGMGHGNSEKFSSILPTWTGRAWPVGRLPRRRAGWDRNRSRQVTRPSPERL